MRQRAYTLVEVMAVLAILVILSALLFPTFSAAKRSSKRSVCVSNLRQCGVALILYVDSNGDSELPQVGPARAWLGKSPTCDPGDSWRRNCSESFGDPLIGSYAYVRAIPPFDSEGAGAVLRNRPNPILMLSPFYSSPPLPAFHGDIPSMELCQSSGISGCPFPRGVLGVRMDGSVGEISVPNVVGSSQTFSWSGAFMSDNEMVKVPE